MFIAVSMVQILPGSASLVGLSCEKRYVWLTVCPSSDEKPTHFTINQNLVGSFLLVSLDRQFILLHPGTSFDNCTPQTRTASFSNILCAFLLFDHLYWPSFAHKKKSFNLIFAENIPSVANIKSLFFPLSRSLTNHICVYVKIVPRFYSNPINLLEKVNQGAFFLLFWLSSIDWQQNWFQTFSAPPNTIVILQKKIEICVNVYLVFW